MKKLFYLTMMFIILFAAAPAAASSVTGFDGDDGPPGLPYGEEGTLYVFLPVVINGGATYQVAGQIKDAQDLPLSDVTITGAGGETATTDANGFYNIRVMSGDQQFQASKPGYVFDPEPAQLEVDQDIANLNFTGMLACANVIPNPSFEVVPFYWNPISGNANGYTPTYSNERAKTGINSGLTGIRFWQTNLPSWSRWRTHEITIPAGTTSADLFMSFWPASTEPIAKGDPEIPAEVGFDTEAPDAPMIYDDAQYIAVIDPATNVVLDWLLWIRMYDQAWVTAGPIDLLPWTGTTIKLEFGTYNDGLGGVTYTFFDDVDLTICPAVPPTSCDNYTVNPDFEGIGGWIAKPSSLLPTYTTQYWFSPFWSVLSGVADGAPNPFPGVWTTTEFYQTVTIPADAYYTKLSMRLLPHSTQIASLAPETTAPEISDETYAPMASESQYAFIMDATGTIDYQMLFKWPHLDSLTWLYREFDVIDFRGQTISVLFGAANDGINGDTGLYVDDVFLYICK
jgi:hypothetical protein